MRENSGVDARFPLDISKNYCVSRNKGLLSPIFKNRDAGLISACRRAGIGRPDLKDLRSLARIGGRGIVGAVRTPPIPPYQQISCPYFCDTQYSYGYGSLPETRSQFRREFHFLSAGYLLACPLQTNDLPGL